MINSLIHLSQLENYDDDDEMQLQEMNKRRTSGTGTTVHVVNHVNVDLYAPNYSQVSNYMYPYMYQ